MTYGGTIRRQTGRRKRVYRAQAKHQPCPLAATRYINGKPYCEHHAPSRYRIDPFYDTPGWRVLRQKVLERDHHECQYCGGRATQADHVIPRKKGGADAMKNLVACCASCNKAAGNTKFSSFDEKKRYVLANRKPRQKRPQPELDAWHREIRHELENTPSSD
jgi:5-methylcytosine-specific restriction endonuclease McrA